MTKNIKRFIRIISKCTRHDGNYIANLFNRFDNWGRDRRYM